MTKQILPVFLKWSYQFTVGDSVFHEDYGRGMRFRVKEVLHARDGAIRLVLYGEPAITEIANENQLTFASSVN